MKYSNYKKGKKTNASLYEAIGKMVLSETAKERTIPAALGLINKAMTMDRDPEYEELLEKPLWQFTGKDHVYLLKHVLQESLQSEEEEPPSKKRYVQGYQGIATLFGCSKSTAQRIKKNGIIDEAITQVNRKILVDADLALQLVKESGYNVREQ